MKQLVLLQLPLELTDLMEYYQVMHSLLSYTFLSQFPPFQCTLSLSLSLPSPLPPIYSIFTVIFLLPPSLPPSLPPPLSLSSYQILFHSPKFCWRRFPEGVLCLALGGRGGPVLGPLGLRLAVAEEGRGAEPGGGLL